MYPAGPGRRLQRVSVLIALGIGCFSAAAARGQTDGSDSGITMPWEKTAPKVTRPADKEKRSKEKTPTPATEPDPREPAAAPGSRIEPITPWWTPQPDQETYARASQLPIAMRSGEGLRFALVPPGTFKMGSSITEPGRDHDETPAHQVTIPQGFYLGATEVTNAQYERFITESKYDGEPDADDFYLIHMRKEMKISAADEYPVVYVSWRNAMVYCAWLTEKETRAGRLWPGWRYRLPTEAEWEYACRAGTQTEYSFGKDPAMLDEYGWYIGNSGGKPQPVARKKPNPWGFYDIHGNVWEWCQSQRRRYPYDAKDGREDLTGDNGRILRSGSWARTARYSRSADRNGIVPTLTIYEYGFRVACVPPAETPEPAPE